MCDVDAAMLVALAGALVGGAAGAVLGWALGDRKPLPTIPPPLPPVRRDDGGPIFTSPTITRGITASPDMPCHRTRFVAHRPDQTEPHCGHGRPRAVDPGRADVRRAVHRYMGAASGQGDATDPETR